jgi:hypothetical protein
LKLNPRLHLTIIKKFPVPVLITAEFETLIKPIDNEDESSKTIKIAELPPCSYAFNIISDYPELNYGLTLYRGNSNDENIAEHFIKSLLEYGDIINQALKTNKPMIITEEQEAQFQETDICHICERKCDISYKNGLEVIDKVRDHEHLTGLYRGCACNACNLNACNLNFKHNKIPAYFNNLKGFDGHLIIQGLKKMNFEKNDIIAQNFEKYMKIEFGNFVLLDSYAFLSSLLDELAKHLLNDSIDNFKHSVQENYTKGQNLLL